MELSGRVAIVTGAGGGGSGRAIARRLARGSASVVVSDIDGRETLRRFETEEGRAAFLTFLRPAARTKFPETH